MIDKLSNEDDYILRFIDKLTNDTQNGRVEWQRCYMGSLTTGSVTKNGVVPNAYYTQLSECVTLEIKLTSGGYINIYITVKEEVDFLCDSQNKALKQSIKQLYHAIVESMKRKLNKKVVGIIDDYMRADLIITQ